MENKNKSKKVQAAQLTLKTNNRESTSIEKIRKVIIHRNAPSPLRINHVTEGNSKNLNLISNARQDIKAHTISNKDIKEIKVLKTKSSINQKENNSYKNAYLIKKAKEQNLNKFINTKQEQANSNIEANS